MHSWLVVGFTLMLNASGVAMCSLVVDAWKNINHTHSSATPIWIFYTMDSRIVGQRRKADRKKILCQELASAIKVVCLNFIVYYNILNTFPFRFKKIMF